MTRSQKVNVSEFLPLGWEDVRVKAVTFPAPPVKAKDTIYAEDCWSSDTVERGIDIFSQKESYCDSGCFSNRGPAFVVTYKMGSLFRNDSFQGILRAQGIYCAGITFERIYETTHTGWANKAMLERVSRGAGSCHPASHTSIPLAPHITLALQVQRVSTLSLSQLGSFRFADDEVARQYFPYEDFSQNLAAESIFEKLGARFLFEKDASIVGGLSNRLIKEYLPKLNVNDSMWNICKYDPGRVDRVFQLKKERSAVLV